MSGRYQKGRLALLLLAALGLAACEDGTPAPVGPEPVPTPTPLSESCKIREPIPMAMDVKGDQRQVFFAGEIPTFRAHPVYEGDDDDGFDRADCPAVWDWELFDEAASGCRPQGSEGFPSQRYDCHLPGPLTVRACVQDITAARRCGTFFTEVKGQ